MKNILRKKNLAYCLYGIVFLAILFLLVSKCRYGFGNLDEAFYLTMPLRYCQGDTMFLDEWHLCMMSGYIMTPLMGLYLKLFHSTESIILHFRYIYLCIWAVSSFYIFTQLKKYSLIGSMVASIIFLIYAPYNMMALSYNTMGLLFLTLSLILYATNENNNKLKYYFAGTFLSLSVLCCPALVLLFVIYCIYELCTKNKNNSFTYVILGIATQLIIFLVFVFTRSSLPQIIESFPYILNDGEHNGRTLMDFIKTYVLAFPNYNSFKLLCLYGIVLFISLFDKKKDSHKEYYYACVIFVVLVMLINNYIKNRYINMIMFPFTLLGPVYLFFDRKNHLYNKLFNFVWIPGIIYSLCIHITSDQSVYVIMHACTICSIISVVLFTDQILKKKRV